MSEHDNHDNDVERTLGRLESAVAAIHENTKVLPELTLKVERHDNELRAVKYIAGAGFLAIIGNIVGWIKSHLGVH